MHIVSIKIGAYQFSPPLLGLMAGLFLIAIFAGLGRWQVSRMYEKQQIEEQYNIRSEQAIQSLPALIDKPQSWRYSKVRVNGMWLTDKQFLLDNQVRGRQAGYNVLTPFKLTDGRVVLIDRGWLPLVDGARDKLPNISFATSDAVRRIEGQFYTPFEGNGKADEKWFQTGKQIPVIPHLDFAVIGTMLGTSVEPFTIRMSATQENGYLREWPIVAFSSTKHLGYAVQWFALALTVFLVLVVLSTKRWR